MYDIVCTYICMHVSTYTPAEHPVKHGTSLVTLRGELRWSIAMFFDSQTHSQFLRLNKLPGKLLSWQIWERNRRTRWIDTSPWGYFDIYNTAPWWYKLRLIHWRICILYISTVHTHTHTRTHIRTHTFASGVLAQFGSTISSLLVTSHHIACILALHRYKRHLTTRYTCISTQCMINVK